MNTNTAEHHKSTANVKPAERIISLLAGSFLIFDAIKNNRKFKSTEMIAGGYLLSRGLYGYCPMYDLMGKGTVPDMVRNINITFHETINRPRQEVYNYWRQLSNLPKLMPHLKSVTELSPTESEWTINGPAGIGNISWKAAIVKDEPGYLLGWSSLEGSTLENAGKVTFLETAGNSTDLQVVISYRPPAGAVGAVVAKLFNPAFEKMVRKDISKMKEVLETGPLVAID